MIMMQAMVLIAMIATPLQDIEKEVIELVERVIPSVVPVVSFAGVGTGVVIADGIVLTNQHVVGNHKQVQIIGNKRSRFSDLIVTDPKSDLAVIHVDTKGLKVAKLKYSEGLKRGQLTIAIGNPYGIGNRGNLIVSQGIIGGLGVSIYIDPVYYGEMIQTTSSIHPGNSGGPLFNISGEVIGINTAIQHDVKNIGFAIPFNTRTRSIIQSLMDNKKIEYAVLGINITNSSTGVKVTKVFSGSVAAKIGLKKGDIILKYREADLRNVEDLMLRVKATPVQEAVEITIKRQNITLKLQISYKKEEK